MAYPIIPLSPQINTFVCPTCGEILQVHPYAPSLPPAMLQPGQSHTFEAVSPTPWANEAGPGLPGDWERITPVRPPTMANDVWPQLATATIGGIFITAGSLITSALIDWPWWAAAPAGLVTAYLSWLVSSGHARATLTQVERWTSSPEPAAPAPPAPGIQVELKTGKTHWEYTWLPGDPAALQRLAQVVLAGESFTERTATTAGLTQEQFKGLRDECIGRGLAVWNHPTRKQQGVTITRNGRAVLRAIEGATLPVEGD